jgi:hypothetical protein
MATRSERQRAASQRTKHKEKTPTRPRAADSRRKRRSSRKATYALEAPRKGRPSRKSSRKSANRAKPDAAFNITETVRKGAPTQLYRKARARATHPRGGSH